MKTKLIRPFVALALLALPALVQAQFTFTTNSGAITITGYNLATGLNVVIPASTDFKTWIPLQTNLLGSGQFYFSDPQSATNVRRFYRSQLSP